MPLCKMYKRMTGKYQVQKETLVQIVEWDTYQGICGAPKSSKFEIQ